MAPVPSADTVLRKIEGNDRRENVLWREEKNLCWEDEKNEGVGSVSSISITMYNLKFKAILGHF